MPDDDISPELSREDRDRFGNDPGALFAANLMLVEDRISAACRRAKRPREAIRLLPITKTVPPRILRYAFRAGMKSFGENKVQEAMDKQQKMIDLSIDWSIVGHLQTNKVKHVTRFAKEFQALDSDRVAIELNKCLERAGRSLDVFLQVNTSQEASKFGIAPHQLRSFVDNMGRFPNLRPKGLMTLAVFSADMKKVRTCFQLLRQLRDELVIRHPEISKLSMGMSGDFEEAIEEGADVIRVGQAIFGHRPTSNEMYWPTTPTA